MPSAREILAASNIVAAPALITALDTQLSIAVGKTEEPGQPSQLAVGAAAGQIIAIFLPDSAIGKGTTDKQGVGLFYSTEPVPTGLSGDYRLEVLEKGEVLLYKGKELVWSGKSATGSSSLAGTYEITF